MSEFTEFPIPRKDVDDTTESQKTAIRTALGVPAAADLDTETATRLAADNRRAFAGGVAFDVSSAYADLGDIFDQDMETDWAFSLMVRGRGLSAVQYITGKSDSAPSWYLRFDFTGKLRFNIKDGTTSVSIVSTENFDDGDWHYVVGVVDVDSSDGMKLFVDGVEVASGDPTAVGDLTNAENLYVGNREDKADGLLGDLRDVTIFNRALSATEAAELSEIGLGAWLAVHPEDQWGGGELGGTSTWAESDTFTTFTSTGYDNLDFTVSAESGTAYSGISTHTEGRTVLVPYTLTVNSGSLPAGSRLVFSPTSGTTIGTPEDSTSANLEAGTHVARLTFTAENGSVDQRSRLAIKIPSGTVGVSITFDPVIYEGALAAYPMNEGNGRQLRDLSGRYDALLSETGYQHLQPKSEGYVRVKGADANPSIMMLEDSDIIPADAVWTQIIAEERIVDIANTAQDLADRRIRLNPSGSDLQIQRSDGSNHETLGTVTAPTSLSDVDAEIHYKQQAR